MSANLTIQAVIEAAIYVDDLDQAERFYRDVLGLPVIGKEPGRHVFFQVGASNVLLAFLAEATLKGDHLPAHGTKGPGHFALGIASDDLGAWRQRLTQQGVSIEKEMDWPRGGKSVYFRGLTMRCFTYLLKVSCDFHSAAEMLQSNRPLARIVNASFLANCAAEAAIGGGFCLHGGKTSWGQRRTAEGSGQTSRECR